jgi:hypothetical protein
MFSFPTSATVWPARLEQFTVDMHAKDNHIGVSADPSVGRSFLDAEGARWRVYEQAFADYDRRSGMSLIFASESAVRRVRDYPADWMQLSDAELVALSWNA